MYILYAVPDCSFFLCRLKINHMMGLQTVILEFGAVTKIYFACVMNICALTP
jgi:hypothetical protein